MKSIIIGSEFGEIAAALRFKTKNHQVTLIEKHPDLGEPARVFKKNGFLIFLKKALPLTILTAIIYLIALFYLSNFYGFNDTILKVIFIGLASLIFQHILLKYILEKNEK
jgi:hypothetical protein